MIAPGQILNGMAVGFLLSHDTIIQSVLDVQKTLASKNKTVKRIVFYSGNRTDNSISEMDIRVSEKDIRQRENEPLETVGIVLPYENDVSGHLSIGQYAADLVERRLALLPPNRMHNVAIWGAGYYGRMVAGGIAWPSHVNLIAVLDNNPELQGKSFEGHRIQPVTALNELDVDLVLVCIAGHRQSVESALAALQIKHSFYSPFDQGISIGKNDESIKKHHSRWYDLRDLSVWVTPGDGFLQRLQERVVALWKKRMRKSIRQLDQTLDQFERDEGDPAFRSLDQLNVLSEKLTDGIQHLHPVLSKGLGKSRNVLNWQTHCIDDCGESWDGKTVLDIGFGTTLLNAMLMHVEGAEKVISMDPGSDPGECEGWAGYVNPLFHLLFGEQAAPDKRAGLFSVLSQLIEGMDYRQQRLRFNPDKIEIHYCGLESLALEANSVDMAFSYTVLEHVEQYESAFINLYRIMKPGALSFHYIDYGPHGRPDDSHLSPLFSPKDQPGLNPYGTYLNRLKTPDFKQLFTASGFNIEAYIPGPCVTCSETDYNKVHQDFTYLEKRDLSELTACFYLRKPS